MKNILLALIGFFIFLNGSAQTNTVLPQWIKGDFKKVTYENINPVLEEGTTFRNDTTITTFIWEVMDVLDTSIILSVLPINIELKTTNENLLKESQFLIDLFKLLREKGVAIPYIAHKNGVLFAPIENSNLIDNFNDRYILQNDLMKAVKNIPFSASVQEYIKQNKINQDSLARYLLLTYLDGMISVIHAPFGQNFNYNQAISATEMSKEDWKVYLPNLNYEKSQNVFSGQYQFLNLDNKTECPYKFETDFISPNPTNDSDKKKKTKKSSSKEDFVFKIVYSGNYMFNSDNFIPVKYFFQKSTIIKKTIDPFSRISQETVTFE
jgi:hypothetical protein